MRLALPSCGSTALCDDPFRPKPIALAECRVPKRPNWMVAAFVVFAFATPVRAHDVAPADPGPEAGVLHLLPPPSTTRHAISLGERSIAYSVTAGTLPLRDAKGVTTAEIFHVAYAADRPITFVSNGGPGAASAFLHLGAIGPRLVAFDEAGGIPRPPARLVDNPDTWLEFTDLVFVDP